MKRLVTYLLCAIVAAASISCGKEDMPVSSMRRCTILYSAGYNNLSGYLQEDIREFISGDLPYGHSYSDLVFVFTHSTKKGGGYSAPTSPYLIRFYKSNDRIIADTILTLPAGTVSASAKTLNYVLTFIKDNYPSNKYGLIFSSHATGFLPAGYYANPYEYDKSITSASVPHGESDPSELSGTSGSPSSPGSLRFSELSDPVPVPYVEEERDPALPLVKSIGATYEGSGRDIMSYEMEIADFARAIPMPLEYILFDCCLMGGVETAFELRDKCRMIAFSQAEVLATGMDYTAMLSHLRRGPDADLRSLCKDYFEYYDRQSGAFRSATISLVDCDWLDPVADVCAELFAKYSDGIKNADPNRIQRYYTSNKHWFYDLRSIIEEAGASPEEIARFDKAMSDCIIYKAATPSFLGSFEIKTHSGLSMYLPSDGSAYIDRMYRELKWNKATGLVK